LQHIKKDNAFNLCHSAYLNAKYAKSAAEFQRPNIFFARAWQIL
jgi:hypothetical protein